MEVEMQWVSDSFQQLSFHGYVRRFSMQIKNKSNANVEALETALISDADGCLPIRINRKWFGSLGEEFPIYSHRSYPSWCSFFATSNLTQSSSLYSHHKGIFPHQGVLSIFLFEGVIGIFHDSESKAGSSIKIIPHCVHAEIILTL